MTSARRTARAVIAGAVPYAGARAWRLLDGHLHFVGEQAIAVRFFEDGTGAPSGFHLNALAELLVERISQIRPVMANSSGQLAQLLDVMDWLRESELTSMPNQLLLNVRAVEVVSSQVQGGKLGWAGFVQRRLMSAWVSQEIRLYLNTTILAALHRLTWGMDGGGRRPSSIERERWFNLVESRPGGLRLRLDRALPQLDRILGEYDGEDALHRALRATKLRVTGGQAAAQWTGTLRKELTMAVNRLQRERNMIAHGGPMHSSSIEAVIPLSVGLSSMVVEAALQGVLDGQDVASAIAALDREAAERIRALEAGRLTY